MPAKKQAFDMIIAGGGLAGMLTALSLSQLRNANGEPLSLAIVEAVATNNKPAVANSHDDKTEHSSAFDARVLALSHASMKFLSSLSLWQQLKSVVAPIKHIHISDRYHYGKARIAADTLGVDAVGYVIEMLQLAETLRGALQKQHNITWFCPDKIEQIDWQIDSVIVGLSSQQTIEANLLIACDGAQSACRQFANIATTTKAYTQSAIIANVTMERAHHNRAFERFTDTGPIALLPLNESEATGRDGHYRCSIVWTLPPEQAKNIIALADEQFADAFTQAFGYWLGGVCKVGKRWLFPLNLVQAEQQIHHRMVLVGNASHTLHPIAGQGFNLGLRDVEQLTEFIRQRLVSGQPYANLGQLSQYQAQRKQDHQHIIALTDSLVTLFSNQLPPLVAGRNIGLKVLNYLTPLKKAFADKTMGY